MTRSGGTRWQPLAQVALRDDERRQAIASALADRGWAVLDSPTGYHLVERLSGALIESAAWLKPDLVVVDAFSPGCTGLSIARGLRELGWTTPVVLVAGSAEERARIGERFESSVLVTDTRGALETVLELAAHLAQRKEKPHAHVLAPQSFSDRRATA